ncbi:protein L21 [Seminavis robusta]|uniref:Large ribosomal subunit protein bL21m n=1 Tax=Seminavis robusta TaxID=568900 RepID=A0A9N8HQ91_9STRA|nr:protein L21 [Seminavis robusta]|eukprot:Sro1170_g248760.1 protein L21 (267) ;mRNA; r:25524-26324
MMISSIARQLGTRAHGSAILRRATVANSLIRPLSSNASSRYAVVDHAAAYEESMQGLHGKQLQLAQLEGIGKDDADFDPFLQEELEEDEEDQLAMEGDEDDEEDFEYEPDDNEADEDWPYNNDGSLKWKKSQLVTFRAGAPAGGMFAVVELAGSQHKVTTDDLLVVNVLQPVDLYKVGSVHTLKDVMLVGSSHLTLVGMPYVTGAEVDVMVEEITQDAKVIVFKKRRRKNYKRKKGHRRDVTLLRILDVRPPKEHANHVHVQRENP